MTLKALHVNVTAHVVETLSELLFELGALSVSIEDQWADTEEEKPIFGEPGAPHDALWEKNKLTALFDVTIDLVSIVQIAFRQLNLPLPECQIEEIEDTDWVRATQSQFNPIEISKRLWITPSWHTPSDTHSIQLILDPGLAFGTGSHSTTRLCLEWLDQHDLHGKTVLDYGCGSGILAIAAIKLGALKAEGIDIDPQAIIASIENAKQNKVDVVFYDADISLVTQYDIVIANILTNPLKVLAPALAQLCKPNGEIVLSGILSKQAEEVIAIYSRWFDISVQKNEEGWVLIHGYRHS